ncbi:C-reactive protein-like [Pleurodeles waltl]|uniref:C-reactive protein-like n=1 Tax=Pleurodeles waltl TaxID=8319 RepID=UPI003709416F
MDRAMLCTLVLLSIVQSMWSFVQRDMTGDVFVYQMDNKQTQVALQLMSNETLRSFTICLRTFTDRSGPYGLFELITHPPFYSEITIFKSSSRSYTLTVRAEKIDFLTKDLVNQWVPLCFSWESATGTACFWENGVRLPRHGLNRGHVLKRSVSSTLGKRRESPPYIPQYVGELDELYMWDYVLSNSEVLHYTTASSSFSPGNILNWRNLTYNLIDDVVVEPF